MSYLLMVEQAAPETPSTNQVLLYPKSDGRMYSKDDTGAERAVSASAASTTDNAVARYDGTAGALQNSAVIIDDSNNVTGVVALTTTGVVSAGTTLELGHASDTTLARTAAGRVSIEGVGIVKGPASATDNALARFDSTTGELIQNSGVILDDSNGIVATGTTAFIPQWFLKNTFTDASGPYLILGKHPTDNSLSVSDTLGTILFRGLDTGGTSRDTSYITSIVTAQDATTVTSRLDFLVGQTGALVTALSLGPTGVMTTNGAIELGHASDTTLSRTAAGRIAIEGVGIVKGPASSTDNAVARFDSTTGELVQNSGLLLNDSDQFTTDLTISKATASATINATSGTASCFIESVGGSSGQIDLKQSGLQWRIQHDGVVTNDLIFGRGATPTEVFRLAQATGNATFAANVSAASASGSQIATQAEQETGSATDKLVTPGRQQYHPSAAKAWCQNDTGTIIPASYNMTSVTDNGAGDHTFTWNVDFSGTAYAVLATPLNSPTTDADTVIPAELTASRAVGSSRIVMNRASDGALTDPAYWMVAAFGDQ